MELEEPIELIIIYLPRRINNIFVKESKEKQTFLITKNKY